MKADNKMEKIFQSRIWVYLFDEKKPFQRRPVLTVGGSVIFFVFIFVMIKYFDLSPVSAIVGIAGAAYGLKGLK